MDIDEHIKYWLDSAKNDLEAAEHLFNSGKFDWCLFIGHLVVEKSLKAYYVYTNNNKIPPKTHNLLKLAELSNLNISENKKLFLDEVNDFNLEVRYPEYRKEFYKICNRNFTNKYHSQIKDFFKWIKSQIEFKK